MKPLNRQPSDAYPPFSELAMPPAARRAVLMGDMDVLIDVGANAGQYARWVRAQGFRGRIISFEPTAAAFQELARTAGSDPRWECYNKALGPSDSEIDLHVAENSICTSVFTPTPLFTEAVPDIVESGIERVPMRSLGSMWPELDITGEVYLKVDVEGFELQVLSGALSVLPKVSLIELEVSLVPLYTGAPLVQEVLAFLDRIHFSVVALEQNGGDDPSSGQMLMIDAIFGRRRSMANGPLEGPS